LLKLPAEIQLGIKEKKIDMGHARAILGSTSPEQQLSIYKRILQNGLSVRKVEELVSSIKPDKKEKKEKLTYTAQQQYLTDRLGKSAKISGQKIIITFRNEDELNSIIQRIH
jgi:ParB family chromosome partitioning protein